MLTNPPPQKKNQKDKKKENKIRKEQKDNTRFICAADNTASIR